MIKLAVKLQIKTLNIFESHRKCVWDLAQSYFRCNLKVYMNLDMQLYMDLYTIFYMNVYMKLYTSLHMNFVMVGRSK